MLEISFAEKSIRSLCESNAKAEAALGIEAAVRLQRRLADLRAAASVKDLVKGTYTEQIEGIGNELTFDLGGGFIMVIAPNHMVRPALRSGKTDWKKVRRIKVLKIAERK